MKYISLNVKGLIDPQKAQVVKQWLTKKGHVDIITLAKIKTKGEELNMRLLQEHMWLHSFHQQGSGGIAVGVH